MPEDQNIPQENSKEQIANFNEEVANENISQEQAIEQTETGIVTSNLPTGQAGITTSEIENMEVHHHPTRRKEKFQGIFSGILNAISCSNTRVFCREYQGKHNR